MSDKTDYVPAGKLSVGMRFRSNHDSDWSYRVIGVYHDAVFAKSSEEGLERWDLTEKVIPFLELIGSDAVEYFNKHAEATAAKPTDTEGIGQRREGMNTTWRILIDKEMKLYGDSFSNLVSCTMNNDELNAVFDQHLSDEQKFTIWTHSRVYFPATYDSFMWATSVSRHPDGKPKLSVGGGTDGTPSGFDDEEDEDEATTPESHDNRIISESMKRSNTFTAVPQENPNVISDSTRNLIPTKTSTEDLKKELESIVRALDDHEKRLKLIEEALNGLRIAFDRRENVALRLPDQIVPVGKLRVGERFMQNNSPEIWTVMRKENEEVIACSSSLQGHFAYYQEVVFISSPVSDYPMDQEQDQ